MKDYFYKPPINQLSLTFLDQSLESAYRISYQEEVCGCVAFPLIKGFCSFQTYALIDFLSGIHSQLKMNNHLNPDVSIYKSEFGHAFSSVFFFFLISWCVFSSRPDQARLRQNEITAGP